MLPRHANELQSRLERIEISGCVEIKSAELLWWYDQERVTARIWRDLQERWEEVLEACGEGFEDIPLLVGELQGAYLFVWGEGLTTNGKWFQSLGDRAKRKAQDEATSLEVADQ